MAFETLWLCVCVCVHITLLSNCPMRVETDTFCLSYTLEFEYFQCVSREHKWLVVQYEIWSSRDAARWQEELLQVTLPATLDVSLHSLTWLLCRQSQLWVQVWTVVSIYSALVLLSSSTDPVQTNTCGQRNKDVKTKSTTQEVSVNSSETRTHWCPNSNVLPCFTPKSIIRYLG